MITSYDSVSDTFDRPSWYINRIGEKVIIVTRLKIRKWIQREKEGKIDCDAMIIRIDRFYTNATEGPKAMFTCWESFGPLWLHVNEWVLKRNASKVSFYEVKTKKKKSAMYYKRSYKYYVINYYYCYDYITCNDYYTTTA